MNDRISPYSLEDARVPDVVHANRIKDAALALRIAVDEAAGAGLKVELKIDETSSIWGKWKTWDVRATIARPL
tara:strand:+ start:211 stop:429 length:219 start_codon:yes stop_codon:yes gene_type:complete